MRTEYEIEVCPLCREPVETEFNARWNDDESFVGRGCIYDLDDGVGRVIPADADRRCYSVSHRTETITVVSAFALQPCEECNLGTSGHDPLMRRHLCGRCYEAGRRRRALASASGWS